MMLNQLWIVRWPETSTSIVLPILLQKISRKAQESLELLAFFAIPCFFASAEKPGKDRKARKFLALLKSLHRSSKKSLESKDLILASWRQSVGFDYRVNSKNSQETQEWMKISWDSDEGLVEFTPSGFSSIAKKVGMTVPYMNIIRLMELL